MLDFLAAVFFIAVPLAAVWWADRRQHGPMPSLSMPAGQRWPEPSGRQIWFLQRACGCVYFRTGQPCYQPCAQHERAHLGEPWWTR